MEPSFINTQNQITTFLAIEEAADDARTIRNIQTARVTGRLITRCITGPEISAHALCWQCTDCIRGTVLVGFTP